MVCFKAVIWLWQAARGSSLKLIIMSATLDAAAFASYFGGTKIVYIQVRMLALLASCCLLVCMHACLLFADGTRVIGMDTCLTVSSTFAQ